MAAFKGDSIFWIETGKIVPNPYQPRKGFDESRLKELSESIRMYGVLQPLTVSRIEVHDEHGAFKTEYELIAGERRLRASKMAGLEHVPVIIREGDESEQEKLELAIIENLQREDLNAVDRALAFRQLADVFGLSHQQVAKKVGRSREYVSNSIRLLGLPDYMLESLKIQDISEGHARTLLMLNDRIEEQDTLYREILLKKLTVREVERIARKIATDKVRNKVWKGSDPELIEKERVFTETLGTRVQLTKTDYGGKITIDYFSDEDLDTLLEQLSAQKAGRTQAAALAVSQAAPSADLSRVLSATPLEVAPAEVAPVVLPEGEQVVPKPEKVPDAAVVPPVAEPREQVDVEMPELVKVPTAEGRTESHDEVGEEAAGASSVVAPELLVEEKESVPTPVTPAPPAPVPPKPPATGLRAKLAQLFGEAPATPTPTAVVAAAVIPTVAAKAPIQPEIAPLVNPADEPAAPDVPTKKDNDDDDTLYDLKNFSI